MNTQPKKFTHMSKYDGEAPKLKGEGNIMYSIYSDGAGQKYIKVVKNTINSKNAGTIPPLMFPVATAIHLNSKTKLPITGVDQVTGKNVESRNKDTSGFLRAVVNHLKSIKSELM